jgi:hypothetical protein
MGTLNEKEYRPSGKCPFAKDHEQPKEDAKCPFSGESGKQMNVLTIKAKASKCPFSKSTEQVKDEL